MHANVSYRDLKGPVLAAVVFFYREWALFECMSGGLDKLRRLASARIHVGEVYYIIYSNNPFSWPNAFDSGPTQIGSKIYAKICRLSILEPSVKDNAPFHVVFRWAQKQKWAHRKLAN